MSANYASVFPRVEEHITEQHRRKLARLYTFLHRYLAKTMTYAHTSVYALGLFSSDGILLDLFANEEFILDRLHKDGIYASSGGQTAGITLSQRAWKQGRASVLSEMRTTIRY